MMNPVPHAAGDVHDGREGGDGRLRLVLVRRVVPFQKQGRMRIFNVDVSCNGAWSGGTNSLSSYFLGFHNLKFDYKF